MLTGVLTLDAFNGVNIGAAQARKFFAGVVSDNPYVRYVVDATKLKRDVLDANTDNVIIECVLLGNGLDLFVSFILRSLLPNLIIEYADKGVLS